MAIKFEKIKPGMVLLDIHSEQAGNTTMRRLGCWKVEVVSVDTENECAAVRWNGNAARMWSKRQLEKLYIKEPPSYVKWKQSASGRLLG